MHTEYDLRHRRRFMASEFLKAEKAWKGTFLDTAPVFPDCSGSFAAGKPGITGFRSGGNPQTFVHVLT